MSDLRQIFLQEMRALREEGADFANDFPEAARYLEIERIDDRDPYVERLTESFAFLVARIREIQETQRDNGLTQHLLELIGPDLEQPLPSVTVVQFDPTSGFAGPATLPANTQVRGNAGKDAAKIPFQLVHDLELQPISVASAGIEITESNQTILELELSKTSQNKLSPWPTSIPMFLLGDPPVVWTLRFGLLRRIGKIQAHLGNSWVDVPEISVNRLDRPGYAPIHELSSPLAHARDFLCADERFRFVSLDGIHNLSNQPSLRLRFHFTGSLPRGMARAVTKDVFRLHTGVMVNRYETCCQALAWDHTETTMVLRAHGDPRREILDVVSVEGLTAAQPPRRLSYRRFASYRHDAGQAHFQMVRSVNRQGLSVAGLSLGSSGIPDCQESQYLAITSICSDGDRPHDSLRPEGLNELALENPPRVRICGLTRPTASFRPPEQADPRSRLLAFAAGHFEGWMDASRLKDALRHMMWDPAESKRTLIESIQDVSTENSHVFVNGVAWRRMVATIRLRDTTCTPDTWDRLGVIDAFGSVLLQIAKEHTPIGSKTLLRMVVDPAGVVLEWDG